MVSKVSVNVWDAVDMLNGMLKIDPQATFDLVVKGVPCNEARGTPQYPSPDPEDLC